MLCDVARSICLMYRKLPAPTPRSFLRYIADPDFVVEYRPLYIKRSKNLIRTDAGDHFRLSDSVQRLLDRGLVSEEDIGNAYISWTRRESVRKLGFCSTIFRVIGISAILDDPSVPDEMRDYVVYHECLHLRQGYRPERRYHDGEFRRWEHMFPDWERIERDMRRLRGRSDGDAQVFIVLRASDPMRDPSHRIPRSGSLVKFMAADEKRGFVFHASDGEMELSIDQVMALADQDDPDGLYALGMAYLFGWDIEEDRDLGYGYLERAAEAGQTEARALILSLYMRGEYEGIDNDTAVGYAIEAAAEGIPEAQLYAGLAYMDGISVGQDYGEAARLFRMAMNQGDQEARTNLGYLYQNGLGVAKDEAKAFRLYRTAARTGNVSALFHLGICYEFGIGTDIDLRAAEKCYSDGAGHGDPFAAERLGYIYSQGTEGSEPDAERSFDRFLGAAMGGSVSAMYIVGYMYLNGIGTDASAEEAAKWLRMAKDNGHDEAAVLLDWMQTDIFNNGPMHRVSIP